MFFSVNREVFAAIVVSDENYRSGFGGLVTYLTAFPRLAVGPEIKVFGGGRLGSLRLRVELSRSRCPWN